MDMCAKNVECDPTENEATCRTECEADFATADDACLEAIGDLVRCGDGVTCEALEDGTACQGEAVAFLGSCPIVF